MCPSATHIVVSLKTVYKFIQAKLIIGIYTKHQEKIVVYVPNVRIFGTNTTKFKQMDFTPELFDRFLNLVSRKNTILIVLKPEIFILIFFNFFFLQVYDFFTTSPNNKIVI